VAPFEAAHVVVAAAAAGAAGAAGAVVVEVPGQDAGCYSQRLW